MVGERFAMFFKNFNTAKTQNVPTLKDKRFSNLCDFLFLEKLCKTLMYFCKMFKSKKNISPCVLPMSLKYKKPTWMGFELFEI